MTEYDNHDMPAYIIAAVGDPRSLSEAGGKRDSVAVELRNMLQHVTTCRMECCKPMTNGQALIDLDINPLDHAPRFRNFRFWREASIETLILSIGSCTALICFVYVLRADCPTFSTRTMVERLVLWILQRAFAGADLVIVGGFERSTLGMMWRFFQAAWGSKKKFLGFSFLRGLFKFPRKVL